MNQRTQEQLVQDANAFLEQLKLTEHVAAFLSTEYVKSVLQEEFLKLKGKIQYVAEIAPDFLKDKAEELANIVVDNPELFVDIALATFKENLAKDFFQFLKYVSIDEKILLETFNSSNKKLADQFKCITERLGISFFNDLVKQLIPVCIFPNTPQGDSLYQFLEKVKDIK